MANLTLSIDDEVLKRARIKALEQGTTVNALVREYLERFADAYRQDEILRGLVELAERVSGGSEGRPRSWQRAELYDRGRR